MQKANPDSPMAVGPNFKVRPKMLPRKWDAFLAYPSMKNQAVGDISMARLNTK
jgi:hypothetical protein